MASTFNPLSPLAGPNFNSLVLVSSALLGRLFLKLQSEVFRTREKLLKGSVYGLSLELFVHDLVVPIFCFSFHSLFFMFSELTLSYFIISHVKREKNNEVLKTDCQTVFKSQCVCPLPPRRP